MDSCNLLYISIHNDTLVLNQYSVINDAGLWDIPDDTLAVCKLEQVEDNFYKITSIDMSCLRAFRDIRVVEEERADTTQYSTISFFTGKRVKLEFIVKIGKSVYSGLPMKENVR